MYAKSCLKTSSKKTCNLNRSRSADDNQSNNGCHTRSSPSQSSHQHFKLNLGEIPFVVGKVSLSNIYIFALFLILQDSFT